MTVSGPGTPVLITLGKIRIDPGRSVEKLFCACAQVGPVRSAIPPRMPATTPARSPFTVLMGSPPSQRDTDESDWADLRFGNEVRVTAVHGLIQVVPRADRACVAAARIAERQGCRAEEPSIHAVDPCLSAHGACHTRAEDRPRGLRSVDLRYRAIQEAVDGLAGREALLELVVHQELGSDLRDDLVSEILRA